MEAAFAEAAQEKPAMEEAWKEGMEAAWDEAMMGGQPNLDAVWQQMMEGGGMEGAWAEGGGSQALQNAEARKPRDQLKIQEALAVH